MFAGWELNTSYKSVGFVKIFARDMREYEHQHVGGLNVLTKRFCAKKSGLSKGFCFTTLDNINQFRDVGPLIGHVMIPNNAWVYEKDAIDIFADDFSMNDLLERETAGKIWYANRIIIGTVYEFADFPCSISEKLSFDIHGILLIDQQSSVGQKNCIRAIKDSRGQAIRFIKHTTFEMWTIALSLDGLLIRHYPDLNSDDGHLLSAIAVKQNGFAIRDIPNPSINLMMLAVAQNGHVFEYVSDFVPHDSAKYRALSFVAVKQNGLAIRFVKNPTVETCNAAVAQTGILLQYIENPALETMKIAVRSDPWVVQFVRDQESDDGIAACIEAIKHNPYAIKYVRNPSKKMKEIAQEQLAN